VPNRYENVKYIIKHRIPVYNPAGVHRLSLLFTPYRGREHVTLRAAIPIRFAVRNTLAGKCVRAVSLGFFAKKPRKTPRGFRWICTVIRILLCIAMHRKTPAQHVPLLCGGCIATLIVTAHAPRISSGPELQPMIHPLCGKQPAPLRICKRYSITNNDKSKVRQSGGYIFTHPGGHAYLQQLRRCRAEAVTLSCFTVSPGAGTCRLA